jgi:Lysylphosphatidylglycerol synthase TM region
MPRPGLVTAASLFRSVVFRWVFPILISAGLVAWLVQRISLPDLAEAARSLNWAALTALTGLFVLAVYLWDVVCIRWLYSLPRCELSFGGAAEARAYSYLWSALSYEAGQAVLAWRLAGVQKTSLVSSLSRCVLLAMHDLALLLALAFIGTLIDSRSSRPYRALLLTVLAGVLASLVMIILLWKILPPGPRQRMISTRWGNWLAWWQLRHSVVLFLLRLVYFGIQVIYAAVGLRVSGISRAFSMFCGVVPLVLLADAVPSVSGLGTRHAALDSLLELSPKEHSLVFHFSSLWSAGLILGRAGIGLACWWLLPLFTRTRRGIS